MTEVRLRAQTGGVRGGVREAVRDAGLQRAAGCGGRGLRAGGSHAHCCPRRDTRRGRDGPVQTACGAPVPSMDGRARKPDSRRAGAGTRACHPTGRSGWGPGAGPWTHPAGRSPGRGGSTSGAAAEGSGRASGGHRDGGMWDGDSWVGEHPKTGDSEWHYLILQEGSRKAACDVRAGDGVCDAGGSSRVGEERQERSGRTECVRRGGESVRVGDESLCGPRRRGRASAERGALKAAAVCLKSACGKERAGPQGT